MWWLREEIVALSAVHISLWEFSIHPLSNPNSFPDIEVVGQDNTGATVADPADHCFLKADVFMEE